MLVFPTNKNGRMVLLAREPLRPIEIDVQALDEEDILEQVRDRLAIDGYDQLELLSVDPSGQFCTVIVHYRHTKKSKPKKDPKFRWVDRSPLGHEKFLTPSQRSLAREALKVAPVETREQPIYDPNYPGGTVIRPRTGKFKEGQ